MQKNPDIQITKAKAEDLPYIKEKIEKYWLDGRNVKVEQFFVARNKEGKPVGFIRYVEYPAFFEPRTLGVDYYWRGKGIGSMLFEHALALTNKAKPIYILTHIPKYFERYGFEYTDDYPPEMQEKIKNVCRLSRDRLSVMCIKK